MKKKKKKKKEKRRRREIRGESWLGNYKKIKEEKGKNSYEKMYKYENDTTVQVKLVNFAQKRKQRRKSEKKKKKKEKNVVDL